MIGGWLDPEWLPKHDYPEPYNHAWVIYQRLLLLCEEIGVTVKLDGRITAADTDGKLIRIQPKLPIRHKVVSLIHELIHIYCTHLPAKNRSELARAEIQTELILGQIMQRLGFRIDVHVHEEDLRHIPEIWDVTNIMYDVLRPLFFEGHKK